jgi:putative ABC transport system permease protein
MNILQPIVEALTSIASNKLRSALTILGIVIGVAAVIAMLAIGQGAEAEITGSIEGIGTNILFVFEGGDENVTKQEPLVMGDAVALSDYLSAPSISAVAPVLTGSVEITYGTEVVSTSLTGANPSYSIVRDWFVSEGEFINDGHLIGKSSVAVIGVQTAEDLFGRKEGLVGETIKLDGQPFRIIGVLEEKGGAPMGPMGSEDSVIIIPMTTAQTRLLIRNPRDSVDMIYVKAISAEAVTQATEEVTVILQSRHNTNIGEDDFSIMDQQSFLETASAITGVLTIFLGGIAGISLLVGGIGIMNIMLVSVIERTKEIGLRKAMGARKRDILIQFLTESSLLSLIGGILGIILGWGIGEAVRLVAESSGTSLSPIISLDAILLATIFSAAVGLFFGLYPANRAANLEPVEALRYE